MVKIVISGLKLVCFKFFGSQDLLDDWVKFQPDSNDKFDVLGTILAALHHIRPGQMSKNVL